MRVHHLQRSSTAVYQLLARLRSRLSVQSSPLRYQRVTYDLKATEDCSIPAYDRTYTIAGEDERFSYNVRYLLHVSCRLLLVTLIVLITGAEHSFTDDYQAHEQ